MPKVYKLIQGIKRRYLTMMNEAKKLIDGYCQWIKDNTKLKQLKDDWIEIITPYLDIHNDYISIYIKKDNNGYVISDRGYTIEDLEFSGCSVLNSENRKKLLHISLNGFGVQLNQQDELVLHASYDNFSFKKHNLIQAILSVNDIFYTVKQNITSLFYEEVENWFLDNDVRFSKNINLRGKTGFDYNFNFLINKSKKCDERVISLINTPTKDKLKLTAFNYIDVKDSRPDTMGIVIINDTNKSDLTDAKRALDMYGIKSFGWSSREDNLDLLVA